VIRLPCDAHHQKVQPGMAGYGYAKTTSANQVLRGVHQILTCEKVSDTFCGWLPAEDGQNRQQKLLGASLFGTNEIFAPLRRLKQELTATHGSMYVIVLRLLWSLM
jgi:hypothetical protein